MAAPVLSAEQIEEETRLRETLANIKHVIIVLSGKGGVGKSTVSSNLAEALSMSGFQVGIMDLDITGPNIPKMFHVEDEKLLVENDKLIPVQVPPSLKLMSMAFLLPSKDDAVMWRGPVKMGAVRQFIEDVNWGSLDYLVIDMPPGTGDEALSIVQLIPRADGAVIVTTPQDLVSMIVAKAVNMAKLMNVPVLGIVENMSYYKCPDCGKEHAIFGESKVDKVAKEFGIENTARLPIDPVIAAMVDAGEVESVDGGNISGIADVIERRGNK